MTFSPTLKPVYDNSEKSASRRDALAALAMHLPVFTAPGFTFGVRVPPKPAGSDIIEMGWFATSEPAQAFVKDAYAYGWVVEFDWSRWAMSDEGQLLLHSPKAMAEATEEDLTRVLTVCLRGDRWSEGSLNADFERGFAGAWTVGEQNQLLATCFGLPVANKA